MAKYAADPDAWNAKQRERYANDPVFRARHIGRYQANPEAYKQWAREYQERNPEKVHERKRTHYAAHKEEIAKKNSERLIAEPEKVRAVRRTYYAKHVDRYLHQNARRRAALMSRRPRWLTAEHERQIQALYAEAKRLSKIAGEPYHVDHIVPLRGKTVSGLHVPWNLQVIPGAENLRKHNKLI